MKDSPMGRQGYGNGGNTAQSSSVAPPNIDTLGGASLGGRRRIKPFVSHY